MRISETLLDPRVEKAWNAASAILRKAKIRFAPIGGLALNRQGVSRPTMDVDIVVPRTDWDTAAKLLRPLGIDSQPMGFAGEQSDGAIRLGDGPWIELFPGGITVAEITKAAPGSTYRPHPADQLKLRVTNSLDHLIALKLASYLCSGRLQDAADVQNLIKKHQLSKKFAAQLPPSVQKLFTQLAGKADAQKLVDSLLNENRVGG